MNHVDFAALARLRTVFLSGKAGDSDYWTSTIDLESYDQTFAQRIAWKWRHVFSDLRKQNWLPPETPCLDWGCGTGIAAREFLREFGVQSSFPIRLYDRSTSAMNFAEQKLRDDVPNVLIQQLSESDLHRLENVGILLVSHVLTELESLENIIELASRATAVVWVDAGTYECSRAMIAVRERLREQFHVVAPCVHDAPCGMLDDSNKLHWCHHFAESPPEVFTERAWSKFGSLMGIDLRQLPLSYLVLDKRPNLAFTENATRVIGRARVYKAHAELLCCNRAGVSEKRLTKRALPEAFRQLKKGAFETLQNFATKDGEITDVL